MIKSRMNLVLAQYLEMGLSFWKSFGYVVTVEEDDYDETSHMVKKLI